MNGKQGFTLIELLIVVAIIGILAAIAVPNFLNAQMRARLARVQADLRSLSTGLEMYSLDHGTYPTDGGRGYNGYPNPVGLRTRWISMTTPVAYINGSNLIDPFKAKFVKWMEPTASLAMRCMNLARETLIKAGIMSSRL